MVSVLVRLGSPDLQAIGIGVAAMWPGVLLRGAFVLLKQFNWKQEVLDSTEPVLVDFWASWCGPCHMMEPTLEALARDFKVCKVNVDTNQQLAARYSISSIPALLIFQNGRVVGQHVGVTSEPTLRAALQQLSHA